MPTNVDPDTGEVLEEGGQNRGEELMLAAEIQQQRIRKMAREHLRDEDNLAKFKLPDIFDNLTIELEQPDEQAKYLINEVFPTGGNITLTAEYKSGKTTLINNVVKALVDDQPFLGRYGVNDHTRNVVIFNYEVEPRQYRQWMREVGIINTDRVKLVHLRGLRMPMTSDFVQERVIDILKGFNAQTWIVDPLARAFVGSGDENSNSDMGTFLDTLDVIKYEAGVENLIVAAHTGRGSEQGIERARGASRFDDWADVRWLLTKNDEGQRFLKAHGRDVDMEQHLLTYDPESRNLTVERAIKQSEQTIENIMKQMVDTVTENPGILTKELKDTVSGGTSNKDRAYKYCVDSGRIIAKQVGTTSMKIHFDPLHPSALDEKLA
jgi:RecA-family ATPase